ncbi:MAG: hypothetical protein ACJAZP_000348 [Psychromonas sp.]|jgi:hypothetical protein|uniref:hypothetical protein n=1 Tax=Psychromonas sp. TaxID=1884585 RepID=UPI0039E61825
MKKNIINNELQGPTFSEEKRWENAVNKSKEKYKSTARRKDKLVGKKREYFKDNKEYQEIKGSDFDDYYS